MGLSYLVPPEVFGQGQEAGQGSRGEGTSSGSCPPRVKEVGGHGFMRQLLPLPAGLLQGPSPRLVLPGRRRGNTDGGGES